MVKAAGRAPGKSKAGKSEAAPSLASGTSATAPGPYISTGSRHEKKPLEVCPGGLGIPAGKKIPVLRRGFSRRNNGLQIDHKPVEYIIEGGV
jgi:hypothetical protein